MLEYNIQDVVAEEAIAERLRPWPMPDVERRIWELDQLINDRGIPSTINSSPPRCKSTVSCASGWWRARPS